MTRSTIGRFSVPGQILALSLVVASGMVPAVSAAELPEVDEVLDRFVEAVGGRTALEQIEVRRYRGTIVQELTWKEPQHQEIPFVAEAHADGRVRYAETSSFAGLDGMDTGEPRRKLRWIMHPRFALVVEEFFGELSVVRREDREGRAVVVLEPAALPVEHYALYFDERTGLLNHVGYHNDIFEWQAIDGVLFPVQWVFGRKGGHTTYYFQEVE